MALLRMNLFVAGGPRKPTEDSFAELVELVRNHVSPPGVKASMTEPTEGCHLSDKCKCVPCSNTKIRTCITVSGCEALFH